MAFACESNAVPYFAPTRTNLTSRRPSSFEASGRNGAEAQCRPYSHFRTEGRRAGCEFKAKTSIDEWPSIQGDSLRVSAHVRRRIERLSIDRPVPILSPERISGRKGVVGELAISRKDFRAGIQP